jgi:hypothetical protein
VGELSGMGVPPGLQAESRTARAIKRGRSLWVSFMVGKVIRE